MGWLFYHRPKGESDRDHFATKLGDPKEILACTTIRNVFYAAVRDKRDDEVFALVILIRRQRGEFNFGYKDMDEAMGPGVAECPVGILDLLTPTDNKIANQWRRQCREHAAAVADARRRARAVVDGTVIVIDHPLTFEGHGEADTFRCVKRDGRRWWVANPGGDEFNVRLGADWATRFHWTIKTDGD
jgi:hypothetical protein